ncbi:hypothetical protein [Streptomyces sp. CA-111067]|uniref:hypothetical protein n=1 Tax=Streptomyces sp. CA-111067 TaxID=3240046 RepID=UPI003D9609C0
MSRITRSSAAAAVLVTAAAVLLGACSSDVQPGGPDMGKHPVTTTPAGSAAPGSTAAAPSAAPGGTGGSTAPDGEAPGSAADQPKVPDPQLTPPGGGTFTKQQKSYLSGRVPKGTDPVAVLEGGQEICDRLTLTVAVDPDAAATAILTGDISRSGATAAVRSLCPQRQPVIDAADHGFGDGTFTVSAKAVPGTSVAPGGYRAPHPSAVCNWRVTGAGGTVLASGPGTGSKPGPATMTVPAAARGITSSGCYAWLASGGNR